MDSQSPAPLHQQNLPAYLDPELEDEKRLDALLSELTLEEKIAALERREIIAALRVTQGNKSQAAALLGLSRQGLLNKMDRYALK